MVRAAALLMLAAISACATATTDLERATAHYEEARYESVLVWLDDLEPDLARMEPAERSTFLYLRGMSAYRLGHLDDAVHYLVLARESVVMEPGSLRASLQSTLDRALAAVAEGTLAASDTFGRTH
jgi:hypothetical protein